jgi:hypothetical protein
MDQTHKLIALKVPGWSALRLGIVVGSLLTLAACASTEPAPNQSLMAAEQAITTAEQARVADYASIELSQARDKLAAAQTAVQQEDMALAKRLADEAMVEAQLATARAGELKAKIVNDDMKESTATLQQEMDRNSNTGMQP